MEIHELAFNNRNVYKCKLCQEQDHNKVLKQTAKLCLKTLILPCKL